MDLELYAKKLCSGTCNSSSNLTLIFTTICFDYSLVTVCILIFFFLLLLFLFCLFLWFFLVFCSVSFTVGLVKLFVRHSFVFLCDHSLYLQFVLNKLLFKLTGCELSLTLIWPSQFSGRNVSMEVTIVTLHQKFRQSDGRRRANGHAMCKCLLFWRPLCLKHSLLVQHHSTWLQWTHASGKKVENNIKKI